MAVYVEAGVQEQWEGSHLSGNTVDQHMVCLSGKEKINSPGDRLFRQQPRIEKYETGSNNENFSNSSNSR